MPDSIPQRDTVLQMLGGVMDRMTQHTEIGRILMPGPTYLGMWARDTGVATLGLNRLDRTDLSAELLRRYWSYQITEESDPAHFIFRNKRFANWTDADAYRPTPEDLRREIGAFPTCVYIRTPDFPPGTREIYTDRADPDSVCWLIIALHDYCRVSGDRDMVESHASQVRAAISYLRSRDEDGDGLLEQGPNQDWADVLLRRGKVTYTQAVWYGALGAAAGLLDAAGAPSLGRQLRTDQARVADAINMSLLLPLGYYANYHDGGGGSMRRSLDTALVPAFGICEEETGRRALETLDTLNGPFGPAVIEPGYAPPDMGPAKYPPGQYQNEGVWPWIASYLALAWARVGDPARGDAVIQKLLATAPSTIHEWVDNLNGERHHPDFATGAGALAWAITEGGLLEEQRHAIPG